MLDTKMKNQLSIRTETEKGQLLSPFEREILQGNLQQDLRPEYRRRIEIMLLADIGKSQSAICKALNCSNVTARYWICMAKTGQALQWNDVLIGRPKTINAQYIKRLRELVTHSPQEFGYSFQRWTARWLSKHLAQELSIEVSDRHINRILKEMGLSTRFKHSATTKDAKNNKRHLEGFNLVICELNVEKKSNSSCLGPFKPECPVV